MIIICANPECRHEFVLARHIKRRSVEGADLTEHGFECPKCQAWTHTHFTNPALDQMRQKLEAVKLIYQRNKRLKVWEQYQKLQNEYKAAFDELNPAGRAARDARAATEAAPE